MELLQKHYHNNKHSGRCSRQRNLQKQKLKVFELPVGLCYPCITISFVLKKNITGSPLPNFAKEKAWNDRRANFGVQITVLELPLNESSNLSEEGVGKICFDKLVICHSRNIVTHLWTHKTIVTVCVPQNPPHWDKHVIYIYIYIEQSNCLCKNILSSFPEKLQPPRLGGCTASILDQVTGRSTWNSWWMRLCGGRGTVERWNYHKTHNHIIF